MGGGGGGGRRISAIVVFVGLVHGVVVDFVRVYLSRPWTRPVLLLLLLLLRILLPNIQQLQHFGDLHF